MLDDHNLSCSIPLGECSDVILVCARRHARVDCSTIVASNLLASLDRLLWVRLWGRRTLGWKLDPDPRCVQCWPFHALNFEKKSALKTSVFQSRIWCRLVQIDEKGEWVCAIFKACAVPGCEHRTPHADHLVQKPAVSRSGCDTCEARARGFRTQSASTGSPSRSSGRGNERGEAHNRRGDSSTCGRRTSPVIEAVTLSHHRCEEASA